MIRLPYDGPEVAFVSRVQQSDTVLAHVDTGATGMVSNVLGSLQHSRRLSLLSGAGPWSAQSVKAITVEPQVAAIASVQTPDPTLRTPNLNESGVILNEAEGDLHDVKEMDHNYSHSYDRIVFCLR
jgi:hypothetical protein